jgi:purine-nucleoside phosphorylase
MSSSYEIAAEAVVYIRSRTHLGIVPPEVAIICGSGLGGLVSSFHAERRVAISYAEIPHFPVSSVPGHEGKLVFGTMGHGRVGVVAMVGRVHFYEGHDMSEITLPIRVFHLLDIKTLIGTFTDIQSNVVTNAAGGLSSSYEVGDLVIVKDHINLAGIAGNNPLRGPNAEEFGPRFPALSDAYSLSLRRALFRVAEKHDFRARRGLHEGTYVMVSGPNYETRAESRMLRLLGADVVGMSTVPEVIVARHCGMQVLCISLVTNKVVMDPMPSGEDETISTSSMTAGIANHEDVLQAGKEAAIDMQDLITLFIDHLKLN